MYTNMHVYIYILQQYIPWNCCFFRAGDKSCQRFHNESKTKPNIRGKFFVPFMFICIQKNYRVPNNSNMTLNAILDVFDVP